MAEVLLTQGRVALIDDHDLPLISQYTWCAVKHHGNWYAMTATTGKKIKMHRLIMAASPGILVDHADGDGLNNQRSNLRLSTLSQNQWNRRRSSGLSRFKGVTKNKGCKSWIAAITVNRKRIHLGSFINEADAARAYDEAALEYFGAFACTNAMLGLYDGHN